MKFPELQDPVKGNSLRSNMTNYLLVKGFSEKDVNAVYDSRMFEVIVDGDRNIKKTKSLKPTLANNNSQALTSC
jgi:archaellum component FlaG (FlaF/FlaG flagellin family)